MEYCAWKQVSPNEFVLGMQAERCGRLADIRILRPQRKNDLYLCEEHLNSYIETWALHNNVEILCQEEPWNAANGLDWDDLH